MLSPNFYSWVLGFGNRVRVVSPDFVADKISALAREVAAMYEKS